MVTFTKRCKKISARFNSQQSSIAFLFEHCWIEIWKWAVMWSCSCRDSTYFLGVILFQMKYTVSTEFRAIRNFQFTKNFITQEIRQKSRHFTLWTHGNHYPFYKEYDGSTITLLLKGMKGYTQGWESLTMKVLWSPMYYKIEGNYFKSKIWVLYKLTRRTG